MSSQIQAIYNVRSQKSTATISNSIRTLIDEVRRQVKNGVDGDGWQRVIHGWRGGDDKPTLHIPQQQQQPQKGRLENSNRFQPIRGGSMHKSESTQSLASNKSYTSIHGEPPPSPIKRSHMTPRNNSNTTLSSATTQQTYKRYDSKFKQPEKDVESTIVNTIILGKLNKFSNQNYSEVYEFLSEILETGERDFLSEFMKLIFTKAATEETFCPLYARLLKELSAKYPFLLDEMRTLYTKFLDIFQEQQESADDSSETAIQKRKERKYRLGYSQFLTELLKQGIVDNNTLYNTIQCIIQQIDINSKLCDKTSVIEEYSDCLIKILTVLRASTPTTSSTTIIELRTMVRETLHDKLTDLSRKSVDRPSLNNRVRFAMMDAMDAIKQ